MADDESIDMLAAVSVSMSSSGSLAPVLAWEELLAVFFVQKFPPSLKHPESFAVDKNFLTVNV